VCLCLLVIGLEITSIFFESRELSLYINL